MFVHPAKNLFLAFGAVRHICSFLTEDMAASIANAMVLSCLDYCNSLLSAVQSPPQQNSNAFKTLQPGLF